MAFVRLDGIHRQLRFILIVLDLIRQAYRDKAIVIPVARRAHGLYRPLCQQPSGGRIDSTTDPQHQSFHPRVAQAFLDERDPSINFGLDGFRPVKGRAYIECGSDLLLTTLHGLLLKNEQFGDGPQFDNPTTRAPINLSSSCRPSKGASRGPCWLDTGQVRSRVPLLESGPLQSTENARCSTSFAGIPI